MNAGGIPFTPWGMALFAASAITALAVLAALFTAVTKGLTKSSKRRSIAAGLVVLSMTSWLIYGVISNPRWEARALVTEVEDALPESYEGGAGPIFISNFCTDLGAVASRDYVKGEPRNLSDLSVGELAIELEEIQSIGDRLSEFGYDEVEWQVSFQSEVQRIDATFTRGGDSLFIRFTGSASLANANPTGCDTGRAESTRLAFIEVPTIEAICALETTPPPFPVACATR